MLFAFRFLLPSVSAAGGSSYLFRVETTPFYRPRVDNAMVKALARAFRWRKLLETGVYGNIEEIAV
jgi:hypothetical protein